MRLTTPKYADGIQTVVQTTFGGIDKREGARDGAICNMENMTSDHYPVLASRRARSLYSDYDKIVEDLNNGGKALLFICDVADVPYYIVREYDSMAQEIYLYAAMIDEKGNLKKTIFFSIEYNDDYVNGWTPYDDVRAVGFNRRMVVFLSHQAVACVYYDEEADELRCERLGDFVFDGDAMSWHASDNSATYIQARKDTIDASMLKSGDSIHIVDNNREYYLTLRSVAEREDHAGDIGVCLEFEYFPELNVSIMNIEDIEHEFDADTSYVGIELDHKYPSIEHACVCRDRIWGTFGNEIYSCASCEYRNWYRYDNTSADSFYAEIVAVPCFTGIASYAGSVYFFTREDVYRMYGTTPDAFTILALGTYGMDESESRSFAVASQTMFYNSVVGPVRFDGNSAYLIGDLLGSDLPKNAIGAAVGTKYYMASGNDIYVYDGQYGTWQKHISTVAPFEIGVYGGRAILFEGLVAEFMDGSEGEELSSLEGYMLNSTVEFADISEGGIYGVCPIEFTLLMWLGEQASLSLSIQCDGGEWEEIYHTTEKGKHIHRVRFTPHSRCDYYRLRIDGQKQWKLYSLSRSYSVNSSTPYGK